MHTAGIDSRCQVHIVIDDQRDRVLLTEMSEGGCLLQALFAAKGLVTVLDDCSTTPDRGRYPIGQPGRRDQLAVGNGIQATT
jgi:hypothetical protein